MGMISLVENKEYMFSEVTEKKLQLNPHMTRAFTLGFYAHI